MPVQVQGMIQPQWAEIVTVGASGETITEAQNINTAVALGNRIEFLRQRLDNEPYAAGGYFDDFSFVRTVAAGDSSTAGHVQADTPWRHYQLEADAGSLNTGTADSDALGALRANGAAAVAQAITLQKSGSELKFGNLIYLATRVHVGSIASGMKFEIGLLTSSVAFTGVGSTTPTDVISILFDPAVSANWQLRKRTGGNQGLTDTGVAVVAGTAYDLRLEWDASLARAVIGNVTTFSASNHPSASTRCGSQLRFQMPASGSNRFFEVDYVAARYDAAARVP